jgi:hypothetical protein
MNAESKLKQIRGGYVVTAEKQGGTFKPQLMKEDFAFNFDNDYISPPGKVSVGHRKLMTADRAAAVVTASNDSPSSSFVNYTNRIRRDNTGRERMGMI